MPSSLPNKNLKIIAIIFVIIAFIGFIDSTYLAVNHLTGGKITCNILKGCDLVTSSSYSEFLGIPVALFGSAFYLFILILSVFYLDKHHHQKRFLLAAAVTPFGFLASAYFTYLQAAVIKAWCQYCILSAITSTTLFVLWIIILIVNRKNKSE